MAVMNSESELRDTYWMWDVGCGRNPICDGDVRGGFTVVSVSNLPSPISHIPHPTSISPFSNVNGGHTHRQMAPANVPETAGGQEIGERLRPWKVVDGLGKILVRRRMT